MTPPMCSTSRRVPWKALFAVMVAKNLRNGCQAALAGGHRRLDDRRRRTGADDHAVAAPVERRRRVLDPLSVAAAPVARKPVVTQGSRCSPEASSADNDDAGAAAGADPVLGERDRSVVLAHAALTCVFGPRAPMMISANCEWPIEDAEEEAPVEGIGLPSPMAARSSAIQPVDLGARRVIGRRERPNTFQRKGGYHAGRGKTTYFSISSAKRS